MLVSDDSKKRQCPYVCPYDGSSIVDTVGVRGLCTECGRSIMPEYGDLTDEYDRVGRVLDRLDDIELQVSWRKLEVKVVDDGDTAFLFEENSYDIPPKVTDLTRQLHPRIRNPASLLAF